MSSHDFKFSSEEARVVGEAIGINFSKVDIDEFTEGLSVELEHGATDKETDVIGLDLAAAGKIAWAHLKEDPEYYTKLKKVEGSIVSKVVEAYTANITGDRRLEELSSIRSYKDRLEFCKRNFKRLAAGSARVVFEYDNDHVLKLAKNAKGVAQNNIESDGFIARAYSDIVASVVASDSDKLWVVAQKAKRVSPKRFESVLGITVEDLGLYLMYRVEYKDYIKERALRVQEKIEGRPETEEWVNQIMDLAVNFGMPTGDFGRISSYGEIDGRVVLTDYGLTKGVHEEFYRR